MDTHNPAYSGNVRQQLHKLYNSNEQPGGPIIIWEGGSNNYTQWQHSAKFCLAPYGFGWGIRLSIVMATGCVPVIIQVRSRWQQVAAGGTESVCAAAQLLAGLGKHLAPAADELCPTARPVCATTTCATITTLPPTAPPAACATTGCSDVPDTGPCHHRSMPLQACHPSCGS